MNTVSTVGFGPLALKFVLVALLASTASHLHAAPYSSTAPKDDAFYHQLLKLPATTGYSPTRTFTIVTDAEQGNRLVAEDDPNLRFNLLWLEQFRPGYKSAQGGSAVGNIVRSYLKTAYKAYRDRGGPSSMLPDENGSFARPDFSGGMDYNLRVDDDEVRMKVEYSF